MATMDQCLTALRSILGDLAANPAAAGLDRSLSCRLTDLDQIVVGRLSSGAAAASMCCALHEADSLSA